MSPIRSGFVHGLVAVVVALLADLRSLYINPPALPDWILTTLETFRTELAFAAFLFLGLLAALRARPTHFDEGASYRQLLVRDGALAATIVAFMVGGALLLTTLLNATVFAGDVRDYARDAAPSITAYNEKVAQRLDDPPVVPPAREFEERLQPPVVRDLGQSIFNFVLRALLIGTLGAAVGAIRGLGRPPDLQKSGISPDEEPDSPLPGGR